MQAYGASGKDTERFRYSQLQLDRFFKGRTVRSLRRSTIHRYITLRQTAGVSPATINRELDDMSAAINWYNFLHELNLPNALVGMALPVPEGRTSPGNSGKTAPLLVYPVGTAHRLPAKRTTEASSAGRPHQGATYNPRKPSAQWPHGAQSTAPHLLGSSRPAETTPNL
ncbi:hypothetical protein G6F57_019271 [Rhizopus arrhizus]|nr:hypothetical protein G6F57_019271 [Rhizopus arrhizus]